jgi:DNA-binding HxlR family transcriptional regulator
MAVGEKKNAAGAHGRPAVSRMVEDVVGCKWTLTIMQLVRRGVRRPGLMERSVEGLTTKVLNERLRKLVGYGVLERRAYAEVPPRVEYELTPFGQKFARVLDAVEELEEEYARPAPAGREQPPRGGVVS